VQSREEPSAVLSTLTAAVIYGRQHPYGFPQLGTEQAIKATARDDLVDFWKQHFVPNNAALIIVGDISRAEAKALAEEKFGAWKGAPLQGAEQGKVDLAKARIVLVDKPGTPQTAVRLASSAPDRRSPDVPVLQVINAGLGGLFTSRINNNLREDKGYTYGARSAFIFHRQPGVFMVQANVRTDATGLAVAEMFKELRGLLSNPYSPEELAKARDSQLLSLPAQFETGSAIVSSLANTYIFDLGLDYYSTLPAQLRAVNSAQVRGVAAKYVKPDSFVVFGVGDAKKIAPELEKLKLGPIEYRDADGNPISPTPGGAR
jgi:zinc protease